LELEIKKKKVAFRAAGKKCFKCNKLGHIAKVDIIVNIHLITFLDNFIHFTVMYLLKSKNEAEKLKGFAQKVETKWNLKIAKFPYDNRKEYINNTVIQCKNKGIEIDTTVQHTPQMNGIAKRLNRTLMKK